MMKETAMPESQNNHRRAERGVMEMEEGTVEATQAGVAANPAGLDGYDPVSYFQGPPQRGNAAITAEHDGVTYRFLSEANRERFLASPERYAPQYGGWCATAVSEGTTAEVDPLSYTIADGRLFVFYRGPLGDLRPLWKENEQERQANADRNWPTMAGRGQREERSDREHD